MSKIELKVYVVQNQDGEFFRAKGFGGGGASWVNDIQWARLYPKIGQARSRVSFFANHYPDYKTPKIIELTATQTQVLDEDARVKKVRARKEKKALERKAKRTKEEREWLEQQEREIRSKLKALKDDS